ncbi:Mettl7b [Symbiodinium microadriaticum]|nr:Mettl7b [Symbiodinium microadriaticum]
MESMAAARCISSRLNSRVLVAGKEPLRPESHISDCKRRGLQAFAACVATCAATGGRHRGFRTLCKAEASDVPRRVAAAAAAVAAADAVLRRDDRYAPSGPTLWPPKAFKETERTELVPGLIWGLEQVIAFFTVSANIRMIVVRMEDKRLWVCGPISPTRECLRLLDELGEVAHLVVPGTALEHKASLSEFSQLYPKATVWVSPGQKASPLDPPLGSHVDGVLGVDGPPPWEKEIDYKVFFVAPPDTAGTYAETAFFHRRSKTLLLTDAVLKVPEGPPRILSSYGYEGEPGQLTSEQWPLGVCNLGVEFVGFWSIGVVVVISNTGLAGTASLKSGWVVCLGLGVTSLVGFLVSFQILR